ncbi:Folylpolyglutamate synthase [Acaryochloris thomasi RCC1774]|uniref:tetrahydrofolate synthase n=1 Tax=Acaryochloris thomasi RCC1774 TaxID=1764569 RepID=A0A2W1K601_9CYAN|nr:folylpolyglutamate synthase/dihydrofolate synthase family protein [Acaryochloris thomasi]PZD75097.1 Folylpolyglutamate synthase [Acaryochloris thomasi RCC1774]
MVPNNDRVALQKIHALLQRYERFGIHLGLEASHQLLAALGHPHQRVPIIHVAGTNGKGSVCAYLSSVLTAAGYRVGRYTSPHLVDWTERICINQQPIAADVLYDALLRVEAAVTEPMPTQFEVITAAAWCCFEPVDIAVIEVGLGGRLDATNVCDSPVVSVITSISRDHWQRLGPTLADIAYEKAGILKQDCAAVVGPLPEAAESVVQQRISELNCRARWPQPAAKVSQSLSQQTVIAEGVTYDLTLPGDLQLINSGVAIATLKALRDQGWNISDDAIATGMANTTWPGRLQWVPWHNSSLLLDGAHNEAAAIALRQYVDSLEQPVHWLMGMLSTKDHAKVLIALLRPGDRLSLVPVSGHSSADPQALQTLALEVCPTLECCIYPDLDAGLQSLHSTVETKVLCGSLYLVGQFLAQSQESYRQA